MKHSTTTDLLVTIPLEHNFCLYSAQGLAFLQSLQQLLQQAKSDKPEALPRAVILLQKTPLDDGDPQWMHALAGNVLWQHLALHLWQVKSLLRWLNQQTVPIFFVGTENCLGSWWELALTCSFRLWFKHTSLVGFRTNDQFALPSLDSSKNRHIVVQELTAREHALPLQVHHAYSEGLISCLCFADDPLHMVREWVQRPTNPSSTKTKQIAYSSSFSAPLVPPEEFLLKFPRWLAQCTPGNTQKTWEFGWQLLKSGAGSNDEHLFNCALTYTLARHFTSDTYWRSEGRAAPSTERSQAPQSAFASYLSPTKHPLLCIDIEECLPPLEIVRELMVRKFEVLLVSNETPENTQRVELLYQKLRGLLGTELLTSFWGKTLLWFPRSPSTSAVVTLQWKKNDGLTLRLGSKQLSYFCLGGNHLASMRSYWEGSATQQQEEAEIFSAPIFATSGLLNILTRGILIGRAGLIGLPYTVWLRFHFLAEVVRISREWGDGLEKTLQSLKANGWIGVGESEWWKIQLGEHSSLAYHQLSISSPLTQPNRETMTFVSWKKTCRLAEPRSPQEIMIASQSAESLHMASFAAMLAHYLGQKGAFPEVRDAEIFTAAALGFPASYKSLRFFVHKWGKKRFYYYWHKHWSEFAGPSP